MEKDNLLTEFPAISTQQWEDLIRDDLKGADYEKKLVWKTNEGIKIKPYYRAEDLQNIPHLHTHPDEFPYVRGHKKAGNHWEIRQDIKVYNIEKANAEAIDALEKGATSICFITTQAIQTANDVSALLKGIHFGCIVFNIQAFENAPQLLHLLIDEAHLRGYDTSLMQGSINFNPLGMFSAKGNWITDEASDFRTAATLVTTCIKLLPEYRVLAANGCLFHEAGATAVQEVAYTLAVASEYATKLTDAGISIDDIAPRIQFNFATGANYFMEIAKIRAFRLLWAKVVEAFKPTSINCAKAFVHCTTARWNMTAYDPYVNILRATTESMSAVIGCADSISVKPFDAVYKKPSAFGYRIARNIQSVLKEEAYLDRVNDPAAGSYYIESLTNSIVEEAWKIFLAIEKEGGYTKAFMNGTVQTAIETIATKRSNDIASRRDTVLGTNQYPNTNEHILQNIDTEVYGEKQKTAANPIAKPLIRTRGAEAFEHVRLATEKSGKRPKVFLLTIGNLAMRLARSQFSANFFGIAGFEIIDNNGFATIDDGIQAAAKAAADIVVLCSSDDEYAAFAPEAFSKLNNSALFVVAGAPAAQPELEAKGIKHFISVRTNVLDTLKYFQQQLNSK